MRQQLVDAAVQVRRKPLQHIAQVGIHRCPATVSWTSSENLGSGYKVDRQPLTGYLRIDLLDLSEFIWRKHHGFMHMVMDQHDQIAAQLHASGLGQRGDWGAIARSKPNALPLIPGAE